MIENMNPVSFEDKASRFCENSIDRIDAALERFFCSTGQISLLAMLAANR